jgi:hypothetical protein
MNLILESRKVAILIGAIALAAGASAAEAAKINGKQCAGMVSEQVNPTTGKKTYACRTVDGDIASGSTVEEKGKKEAPATSSAPAAPKKEPASATSSK